jgi:hypothetical protein
MKTISSGLNFQCPMALHCAGYEIGNWLPMQTLRAKKSDKASV